MIISIRTFINTTFLRIFILAGFRLYTKYDDTPAKEFIHFIGWDNLGNLTVTLENTPLSEQMIADKLNSIEQICARSVRLYMYDQVPVTTVPQYNYANPAAALPSLISSPISSPTVTIPVSPVSNSGNIPIIENNSLVSSSGTKI